MTTFLAILAWELRLYLRRISTWVYFAIFFSIAFLFMVIAGGAFADINMALGGGGKVMANAPYALTALMPVISLLGVSITAALAGNSLYKDYDVHIDPLFYTTPVSKTQFLGGRFTAIVIVNVIVTSGIAVGAIAATLSPWVHADKIAAFRLMAYVQPYVELIFPNLLLTCAIFFALVAFTRQMLPNYVGGAVLLIGYLLAGTIFTDIDDKHLAGLVDPFGLRAQSALTQYWSIAEKNHRLVPLSGVLLENRVIWLAVAAVISVAAFIRFRFSHLANEPLHPAVEASPATGLTEAPDAELEPLVAPLRVTALPAAMQRFDAAARRVQFRSVFARSFWRIVRSKHFGVIVGAGLLYLIVAARATGKLFGTTTWPVTYEMESVLTGSFGIFILVIIAFYSGELVWAERDVHMNQLYDATPIPNGVSLAAKFSAMAVVILALLGLTMIAGILTQVARHYYHFEIPLYLESLLGFRCIDFLLIAAFAFALHVVVNHKYLGHLLVIVFYIGNGIVSSFFDQKLFFYGDDSGSTYSDMNGWGPYAWPFFWWKLYWSAFAGLLLVLAAVYWVRGEEDGWAARTRLAARRFQGSLRRVAEGAFMVWAGAGAFIYYNTNIININRSHSEERHLRAERERRYKRFEHVPQPRITGVLLKVNLQPSRGDAYINGQYVLRNKTASPIDSIHLGIDEDLTIIRLGFDRPATRVLSDRPRNYMIYRLGTPLQPGDSLLMRFDFGRLRHGFPSEITDVSVAGNGTFLENAFFMPEIGYDARLELTDEDDRKKEHLPPRPRMRPPTDATTWANNYVSPDADWIHYDATVSTDPDQLAITSGALQKEWVANGRRYFHYTLDAPIIDLWAFQSAKYAVAKDRWVPRGGQAEPPVDLEIDYHPTHAYNVRRMLDAMKKALDYYTANFGPYQFHQLRIVEFPRYAAFAQSLPNEIPFSESIGFIARVEGPDDLDYPFYVTAHEVAHQWWAHQVVGANAQGSTMLSETLAQYSALMVMEKEFGPANMRRFLEYELNSYLVGRSTERQREMPLELGENQPYIHYNKGSLVMYAMRDYIGEAKMNAAIRGFLDAYKFKGPPYPTSLQLVDSIRAQTPDSLKYLISDMFEHITLYELKTDSVVATAASGAPGKFAVDLYVTAKKLRADSLGAETEVPMNDLVDIGVFAKPPSKPDPRIDSQVGVPLYLAKRRVHSGAQKISVVVDQLPYRAGIDPLHKLIDRITMDNTKGVFDRTRGGAAAAPRAGAKRR
ncbi:MAG TPA: M1 family aminopeptidase [Gemmatimonadaceae bacterium]|nr:M1 family aminopeptidase [Gemmatimonadaceae bacterium]